MRLDSSFESLSGLGGGRSGSVADLADEAPRRTRHSYAGPSHADTDTTPTKPFGLGELHLRIYSLYYIRQIELNEVGLHRMIILPIRGLKTLGATKSILARIDEVVILNNLFIINNL